MFNEFEMACIESEEQKETVREESLVEVKWASVHISITSSEVESHI